MRSDVCIVDPSWMSLRLIHWGYTFPHFSPQLCIYYRMLLPLRDTRWRSWLRHGMSRVRFPMASLAVLLTYSSCRSDPEVNTQPLTEMSTRNISWEVRWPVRKADNLTTFMCQLSWDTGVSTSWNPQELYRDCFIFAFHPSYGLLLYSLKTQV